MYFPKSNNIFAGLKIEEDLMFYGQADGKQHEVKVKPAQEFSFDEMRPGQAEQMPHLLNFCNQVVKLALEKKEFCQIGKLPKFFLRSEKRDIRDHGLEMWPGYEVATKSQVHGIFLNIDTATKFVQKTTILEQIQDMMHQRYRNSEIEDHFNPAKN